MSPQPCCVPIVKCTHFSDVRVIVWTYSSQAKGMKCVVTSRLKLEGLWKAVLRGQSEGWIYFKPTEYRESILPNPEGVIAVQ